MLGKPINHLVRSALIPTTDYVAGTVISTELEDKNQLMLYIDYTKGSSTSLQVKLEFSNDGSTYFQETNLSVAGGTATATVNEYSFGATGKFAIPVQIRHRYIKVSTKVTGDPTGSSCAINATTSIT